MSALVKSVCNSLDTALELPSGARFYRCALQVNPYAYLVRYNKLTTYSNEPSYNAAIIEVCKAEKIEVIAVTDHYRIADSTQLIKDAEAAGLIVFPGFEAATKEGIHFLCLFNPGTDIANIERKIGDCGIHDSTQISPNGKHDAGALLEHCKQWEALCVAAHVAASSGLLKTLKGQPVQRFGKTKTC